MLMSLPFASFHLQRRLYPVSGLKMAFLDRMDLKFDGGDDLSTAVGTKALPANDLIPEWFAEGSDRSQLPKWRSGWGILVKQSAILRAKSEVSMTRKCGIEIRVLGRPGFDKY